MKKKKEIVQSAEVQRGGEYTIWEKKDNGEWEKMKKNDRRREYLPEN